MAQAPNASTNFLSPEDYAQMLRQAEMENRAGLQMNQAPRHWTQALAGALNQGLSGYRTGQAQERNQATQADANAQLAQLLQGGGNIEAAMANPRSAQQAFQYQAQAPQREFQQFKMNQAREMAPLERRALEAQIAAREKAGAPKPKWVKLGTDAYGQEKYGQLLPDGRIMPYGLPGVTPGQAPGMTPGQGQADPRVIPPPPAGVNPVEYYKTAAKELAKTSVKASQDLPSVVAKIDNALRSIKGIKENPAFDRSTSVLTGPLPSVTEGARQFDQQIEQLRGQAFVQAFQDIKGGGAITEAEGKAATQALARLNQATVGSENFTKSLNDFEREMIKLRDIAAAKAGIRPNEKTDAPTLSQALPKRRKFNPDTGRIE